MDFTSPASSKANGVLTDLKSHTTMIQTTASTTNMSEDEITELTMSPVLSAMVAEMTACVSKTDVVLGSLLNQAMEVKNENMNEMRKSMMTMAANLDAKHHHTLREKDRKLSEMVILFTEERERMAAEYEKTETKYQQELEKMGYSKDLLKEKQSQKLLRDWKTKGLTRWFGAWQQLVRINVVQNHMDIEFEKNAEMWAQKLAADTAALHGDLSAQLGKLQNDAEALKDKITRKIMLQWVKGCMVNAFKTWQAKAGKAHLQKEMDTEMNALHEKQMAEMEYMSLEARHAREKAGMSRQQLIDKMLLRVKNQWMLRGMVVCFEEWHRQTMAAVMAKVHQAEADALVNKFSADMSAMEAKQSETILDKDHAAAELHRNMEMQAEMQAASHGDALSQKEAEFNMMRTSLLQEREEMMAAMAASHAEEVAFREGTFAGRKDAIAKREAMHKSREEQLKDKISLRVLMQMMQRSMVECFHNWTKMVVVAKLEKRYFAQEAEMQVQQQKELQALLDGGAREMEKAKMTKEQLVENLTKRVLGNWMKQSMIRCWDGWKKFTLIAAVTRQQQAEHDKLEGSFLKESEAMQQEHSQALSGKDEAMDNLKTSLNNMMHNISAEAQEKVNQKNADMEEMKELLMREHEHDIAAMTDSHGVSMATKLREAEQLKESFASEAEELAKQNRELIQEIVLNTDRQKENLGLKVFAQWNNRAMAACYQCWVQLVMSARFNRKYDQTMDQMTARHKAEIDGILKKHAEVIEEKDFKIERQAGIIEKLVEPLMS